MITVSKYSEKCSEPPAVGRLRSSRSLFVFIFSSSLTLRLQCGFLQPTISGKTGENPVMGEVSGRSSLGSVYVPLVSSSLRPVADVVLGRVVVPPVYLPKPRTVKVHRDGWLFGGVTYPVNAPLIRQHG
jgi:hypothetical protein